MTKDDLDRLNELLRADEEQRRRFMEDESNDPGFDTCAPLQDALYSHARELIDTARDLPNVKVITDQIKVIDNLMKERDELRAALEELEFRVKRLEAKHRSMR